MELPRTLIDSMPDELRGDAKRWWCELDQQEKEELIKLCDLRKELFLFETFSQSEVRPKIYGGRFLPGSNAFGIKDWGEDYFQHLLDHPELILVYEPETKSFHIGCSAHLRAKECFMKGTVEDSFVCPFGEEKCRMRSILNGRKMVNFRRHRN